ncbi:putative holin-like toxin [Lederbergia panacisoli]
MVGTCSSKKEGCDVASVDEAITIMISFGLLIVAVPSFKNKD